MRWLYNLVLIPLLVVTFPLWAVVLWRVPKMRAGFWHKLGFYPQALWSKIDQLPRNNRIWVHAVSVGELNAARGLIQTMAQDGFSPVISTTTLTGYTMAQKQWPNLVVFYCPLDLPWAVACVISRVAPSAVVILETELWPNLLMTLKHHSIPTFLVNGRLSQKSFTGYHRARFWMKPLLGCFTAIFAQSKDDQSRFEALGAQSVTTLGNLKFETPQILQKSHRPDWLNFAENHPLLVVASTHPGEEEALIPLLKALKTQFTDLAMVLAPRHPERAADVCRLLEAHGLSTQLRSQWNGASEASATTIRVLDTVGELFGVFGFATVTLMGGTFVPWGGHNILEPLQMGCPVVFGPSMSNFKAIKEAVLSAQAGVEANTVSEAQATITQLLQDPQAHAFQVAQGQALLAQHTGVTQRLWQAIKTQL